MLAKFIKDKREEVGLTQDDVGQSLLFKCGQFISNWERGVSYPPLTTLKPLAKKYGVEVELLKAVYAQQLKADFATELTEKLELV